MPPRSAPRLRTSTWALSSSSQASLSTDMPTGGLQTRRAATLRRPAPARSRRLRRFWLMIHGPISLAICRDAGNQSRRELSIMAPAARDIAERSQTRLVPNSAAPRRGLSYILPGAGDKSPVGALSPGQNVRYQKVDSRTHCLWSARPCELPAPRHIGARPE